MKDFTFMVCQAEKRLEGRKEMKECCGWWGRFFGHNFVEYTKSSKPGPIPRVTGVGAFDPVAIIEANTERLYAIHCIRCGATPENGVGSAQEGGEWRQCDQYGGGWTRSGAEVRCSLPLGHPVATDAVLSHGGFDEKGLLILFGAVNGFDRPIPDAGAEAAEPAFLKSVSEEKA